MPGTARGPWPILWAILTFSPNPSGSEVLFLSSLRICKGFLTAFTTDEICSCFRPRSEKRGVIFQGGVSEWYELSAQTLPDLRYCFCLICASARVCCLPGPIMRKAVFSDHAPKKSMQFLMLRAGVILGSSPSASGSEILFLSSSPLSKGLSPKSADQEKTASARPRENANTSTVPPKIFTPGAVSN